MNANPLLALLTGVGAGVDEIQQRDELRRRQALAEGRQSRLDAEHDDDRRAEQAMRTFTFRKELRDAGYRPVDDAERELGQASEQDLSTMPVRATPNTATVAGPGTAMLQLIQGAPQRPTPRSAMTAPADLLRGPRETITSPMGESRDYVFDESATPEARAIRAIVARTSVEQAAQMARERAARAEAQAAEDAKLEKNAQAIVAAGVSGQDGKPLTIDQARALARVSTVAPELLGTKNIDPLSKEGIRAEAQRAGAVAAAEAPFKKDANQKNPTELQQRAALVYDRAREAGDIIESFGTHAPSASMKLGGIPLVGNYLISDDQQRMLNAGETLATAVLRLESGAAISRAEAQSYARQFLPQPGDSPDVIKQKADIRRQLIDRIRQAAGPALGDRRGNSPSVAPRGANDPGGDIVLGDTTLNPFTTLPKARRP